MTKLCTAPQLIHEHEDLSHNFKYFFICGNFLGIFPCSHSSKGSVEGVTFSWRSFSALRSIGILTMLTLNTMIAMVGLVTAKQINSVLEFSYYAISVTINAYAVFMYIFMLRNSEQLLTLLKLWKEMSFHYKHMLKDRTLSRDTFIIAGTILTSAILENNLWAIKDSKIFDEYLDNNRFEDLSACNLTEGAKLVLETKTEINPLEEYFNTYYQWRSLVPYNPWIAVYLYITNKFVIYGWNYCDLLILLIARALSMKFKLLNTQFENRMIHSNGAFCYQEMKDYIEDHMRLTKLLDGFQDFLSPLIFASYFVNVYFVCMHLMFLTLPMSEILGPEMLGPQNALTTIQLIWSAVHLILRLYILSFMAAQVVDHGLKIKTLLHKIPTHMYTREVERFEASLQYTRPEFGLNGFGCFTITKSFMLDIFNVFLTIEIVLFQSSKLRWN